MKRSRAAAVAACVCGLALVAACGQGTLTVGAAAVPKSVRIGPYTQVFDSAMPTSSAQAQVVDAFREGEVLWTRSEEVFRLVAPVRDYVTGQALRQLASAMHASQTRDLVPAGTDRLFRTEVASITGSRAVITTCDDGTGFREQNRRTGKIDPSLTSQPQQDYLAETWRMGLVSGHWAITSVSVESLPSQSAQRCQPGLAAGAPSPPSMPVLLESVGAVMRAATSVHVSGTVTQDGRQFSLDLSMTRAGGVSGQVGFGSADITVLTTGGHIYLRVNAAVLQSFHAPAFACELFCGKYLQTTAAQSSGLGSMTMASLMDPMARSIGTPTGTVNFGGTIVFDGIPVWVLQKPQQGTAFVAARGPHYLMRLTAPGQSAGTISFTQWNSARIPGPPPTSQVVNLSQLRGGQSA